MKSISNAQIKFADYLNTLTPGGGKPGKKAVKGKSQPSDATMPMSSEMLKIIENAANEVDHHGCLVDNVSSLLSQPLTSSSTLFPVASVLGSYQSSSKAPYASVYDTIPGMNLTNSQQLNISFEDSFDCGTELDETQHFSYAHTTRPPSPPSNRSTNSNPNSASTSLDAWRTRLNVLWFKRKAELERSEGRLAEAADSMAQAVYTHLGTDDYSQANLLAPTLTDNPLEILQTIKEDFFLYDQLAHSYAGKIQRCYRRRIRRRGEYATTIAKVYRGHVVRKIFQKWRRIRKQCAIKIQRRFRVHLRRMHALATMIKRWYRMRRDMKNYYKRLFIYQMSRHIQRIIRGFLGRIVARKWKKIVDSAKMIQRLVRGYLVRTERAYAIMHIHKFIHAAVLRIQRFIRLKQALYRARLKALLTLLQEDMRQKKENVCVGEVMRGEKVKSKMFMQTRGGRVWGMFERRKLMVRKMVMIENIRNMKKAE
ncbi:hypothetical protein EON65_39750, partial [archaeon]